MKLKIKQNNQQKRKDRKKKMNVEEGTVRKGKRLKKA